MPIADPKLGRAREQIVLEGDVPSPVNPPAACRFHPRCPRFVDGKCNVDEPLMTPVPGESDHEFACHFPLEHWPMGFDEMQRPGASSANGASAEEAAQAPAASLD